MPENIKKIITENLKLKNMLQINPDKLLNLIYTKAEDQPVEQKKPTTKRALYILKHDKKLKKILKKVLKKKALWLSSIKASNLKNLKILKKKWNQITIKKFRKKLKDENEIHYESRKFGFLSKKRKLLNNLLINLIKTKKVIFTDTQTQGKNTKYNSYWKRVKRAVPYEEVSQIRRYKQKKVVIAHSIYLWKMKRWTELSEKRVQIFWNKLNKNANKTRYIDTQIFGTFRRSYNYGKAQPSFVDKNILKLNCDTKEKYVQLKTLKMKLFSKIPTLVFKPANKYTKAYSELTTKQLWLTNKYYWLKAKSHKLKGIEIDFLKTILGQQFLIAHKTPNNLLFQGHIRYFRMNANDFESKIKYFITNRNWARKFQGIQKRAWFYTNSVYPKKTPYFFNANAMKKVYPFNKFFASWKIRPRNPWLSSLISTRGVYTGFLTSARREFLWLKRYSWTPMLRNKLEYRQKRNRIYFHRSRLLYTKENIQKFDANKNARIKQILSKTILPFYGNLRLKQFAKITKKSLIKKTELLSRDDIKLNYLESRLDVVVYRLNLAPNIFWARKLIQDGSIFVSSVKNKNDKSFENMHANYKNNAYPLKLRDPQNLYRKTKLPNFGQTMYDSKPKYLATKLKFLLEPLRNINYLTQPGDVILCAPGALNNQHKSNKILWQKPIPTHLLTYSNLTESKNKFKSRFNIISETSRKDQTSTNVGVVLFSPTVKDLHKYDRVQRSFLRWMSL